MCLRLTWIPRTFVGLWLGLAAGFGDAAGAEFTVVVVAGTPAQGAPPVAGELHDPFGLALDRAGNLLIAELNGQRVRKLDSQGRLSVFAGTGEAGFAGDSGPAIRAQFHWIHNLAVAPNGDVFLADTRNNRVRKVDAATGIVTTVVGTGTKGFSGDGGPAQQANCGGIYCVTMDTPRHRLLLADLDNRRVRAVTLSDGKIETLAGNGEKGVPADGALAHESPLVDPRAVAADTAGNVYIVERSGHALRVVDPQGRIRTVAGTGRKGPAEGDVPAREATLNGPKHLCLDAQDNVIIADTENHVIRKLLVRQQRLVRLVGSGRAGTAGLGGPPAEVELNKPHGVFIDPQGTLYIADSGNHRVLKLQARQSAAGNAPSRPVAAVGKPSMLKFLFLDNRDYEVVENLQRCPEQARKHAGNPFLVADRPWENGNITLYGSVLKTEGRPFQLWYTVIKPSFQLMLAYAESDDGLAWRKPELDLAPYEGRKTNLLLTEHVHGATVIYDAAEPCEDWKYKLLCGMAPSGHICALRSADGIHWQPAAPGPVIGNKPDCPMSLLRRPDGTYAAHHRVPGGGRRIARSESADFLDWHGGRIVLEPGPNDPAQFEMYGMGATMYGDLELGTLWAYHTDLDFTTRSRMLGAYHAELTYSRSGWCWHRVAPGQPLIPRGEANAWDCGNLQCASAPVFLDHEIRYYYAASNVRHAKHWELQPGRFGVGMASLRPDRFVALAAGDRPGNLVSRPFTLPSAELYLNADIARDGEVRMELLTAEGQPIAGFSLEQCRALRGDSLEHRVSWQGQPNAAKVVGKSVRWRLQAVRARLYSVRSPIPGEKPLYYRFRSR